MPLNDFLPFATDPGANVETQFAYAADPQTASGFIGPSIAYSNKCNKVWRQATSIMWVITHAIVSGLGVDVVDDGNLEVIYNNFVAMLRKVAWTSAILTDGSVGVTQASGDSTTKIATDAFVQQEISARAMPVGGGGIWFASAPPTNFLECNGASLSTTTYAALFAAIGYTFGGAGASFSLPDMRGQFARGWDHGAGVDPARAFGSSQTDDFKSHLHSIPFGNDNSPSDKPGHGGGGSQVADSNPQGGTETRPKNVAIMYIIRYQ